MKNTVVLLILSSLVLFSCENNSATSPIENFDVVAEFGIIDVDKADIELMTNESLAKGDKQSLRAYEVKMKYLARGIAKLLNDPEIGNYLQTEIGKQFDGDYDVLWGTIADKNFANKGKLKNILRKLYNSDIDMVDQFNSVPLLQVSAPIHFDKWNVDVPLLVAYNPITKDDVKWKEVLAFDGSGKKYKLDAQSEPDYPVVVIGINERVDPLTGKLYSNIDNSFGKIASDIKDLRIGYVRLVDDKEPWTKGHPEVYYQFINGTTNFRKNYYEWWQNWGSNDYWRHFNKRVMYWHDNTDPDRSIIRWMEKDSGSTINLGLSYSYKVKPTNVTTTASVGFSIKDGDDNMGSTTFHKDDPTSSKANPYTTGDVKFTIYWNNI